MDEKLWATVDDFVAKSSVLQAIDFLESRLSETKSDRFQSVIRCGFANSPESVLAAINSYIAECSQRFDVQAIYLEMNGFDINPDRWYFELFGYTEYGSDPQNIEWLCNWQKPHGDSVTLTGLESVQADFEWYMATEAYEDEAYEKVEVIAVFLVMCKFVSLIQSALSSGPLVKPIPILAAAHDFDIVGRFEPPKA